MKILNLIQSFLSKKTQEEIRDFKDYIKLEFGFDEFLYATREGLPIIGTFEGYEEKAAFLPEIAKTLKRVESHESYFIKTPTAVYTLVWITSDVLFFGKGKKELGYSKLTNLVEKSRKELGLI